MRTNQNRHEEGNFRLHRISSRSFSLFQSAPLQIFMMLGGGAIAPPPNTLVVYWDTAWSLYDLEP
ncbi:MAG: hypothetical protein AAF327_12140, partial [Cyanobacteria bacterium P01_A01_bin.37]